MDRSLDEILAERQKNKGGSRNNRGSGRRRERQQEFPRDGVRKSFRDEPRNLDSEWVHDRYEDNDRRSNNRNRRRDSPERSSDSRGAKIRVENIHYDLTETDLDELFKRIGPVARLELRYDRAGRSEGTAYVTYETHEDAKEAIREFDGANAAGQPIRLTLVPAGTGPRPRNPFDTAIKPGRPLAERITMPSGRSRSLSPPGRHLDEEAARKGIDRYVPGGKGSRSRSPLPSRRREGGRRPGERRGGAGSRRGGGGGGGGEVGEGKRSGRDRRPKKTQQELDAEMADYFGGSGDTQTQPAATNGGDSAAAPLAPAVDDVDMIE